MWGQRQVTDGAQPLQNFTDTSIVVTCIVCLQEDFNYLSVSLADNIVLASPPAASPAPPASGTPATGTHTAGGVNTCEASALEAGRGFCRVQTTSIQQAGTTPYLKGLSGVEPSELKQPAQPAKQASAVSDVAKNPTLQAAATSGAAQLPRKAVGTSPFEQQQSQPGASGNAASRQSGVQEGQQQQQQPTLTPDTRGSSVAQIIARFSSTGGAGQQGSGGGDGGGGGDGSGRLRPWSSGGAGGLSSPTGAVNQQGITSWSNFNYTTLHPLPPGRECRRVPGLV
jgi:hypothetical protein